MLLANGAKIVPLGADAVDLPIYIQEGLSVRLSRQGELIGCFARGPEIVIHHGVWQTSC
jgi:hypothetical protein